MKIFPCLIVLLLSLSGISCVQKKILVLLGTGHDFEANLNQQFSPVVKTLSNFKPRLICIESIPPYDSKSINNIKSSSVTKADLIREQLGLTTKDVMDSLAYYKKQLGKKTIDQGRVHLKLGLFYYLSHQFAGNSDYNYFIASKMLQPNEYSSDTLLLRYLKNEKFTEFYNVVFPVASNSGLKELVPVDDRADYPNDEIAQQKTLGVISASPGGMALIEIYMKAQSDYAGYEKKGEAFSLLNDTAYQNTISSLIVDTYPAVTADQNAKNMKEFWERRNMEIAKRIVAAVRSKKKNNKVLVSFGAAHIPLLRKYLSHLLPSYKIIGYNELNKMN
jgi:Family of unknown function (DUF5694)